RDFTVVSQSDVDDLTKSLSAQAEQQIQGELSRTIEQTETLTPLQCSQTIIASTQVGEEAKEVTVSLTKTCSAFSYSQRDIENQAQEHFRQLTGNSYIPVDNPQVS